VGGIFGYSYYMLNAKFFASFSKPMQNHLYPSLAAFLL